MSGRKIPENVMNLVHELQRRKMQEMLDFVKYYTAARENSVEQTAEQVCQNFEDVERLFKEQAGRRFKKNNV